MFSAGQIAALIACAEALKDIINAAEAGEPYTASELESSFSELNLLYDTGVRLAGEE